MKTLTKARLLLKDMTHLSLFPSFSHSCGFQHCWAGVCCTYVCWLLECVSFFLKINVDVYITSKLWCVSLNKWKKKSKVSTGMSHGLYVLQLCSWWLLYCKHDTVTHTYDSRFHFHMFCCSSLFADFVKPHFPGNRAACDLLSQSVCTDW